MLDPARTNLLLVHDAVAKAGHGPRVQRQHESVAVLVTGRSAQACGVGNTAQVRPQTRRQAQGYARPRLWRSTSPGQLVKPKKSNPRHTVGLGSGKHCVHPPALRSPHCLVPGRNCAHPLCLVQTPKQKDPQRHHALQKMQGGWLREGPSTNSQLRGASRTGEAMKTGHNALLVPRHLRKKKLQGDPSKTRHVAPRNGVVKRAAHGLLVQCQPQSMVVCWLAQLLSQVK